MGKYREFIKLGINHHMLNKRVVNDPKKHCKTLLQLLKDRRFDSMDLWITDNKKYHHEEVKAILSSGKEIIYNIGSRPGEKTPNASSYNRREQSYAMDFFKREIDMAAEVKSKKIVIFSGYDNPEDRKGAKEQFMEFCFRLFEYVPEDTVFLLEPADRDMDKKMLLGPTKESVDFVKTINKKGYSNLKLMMDMCHVPLLHETLEEAVNASEGILGHLHIGNSIDCSPGHSRYGDSHPPFGIENSIYTEQDAAFVIGKIIKAGYIYNGEPNTAAFEMVGYKDITWQDSVNKFVDSWKIIWEIVQENINE
ncbi:MAG: sugar phosphate isomerase/epimerase [Clostridiales bacterium]|nr:sugar phosphate isomerase/epimerase [Clostridiales bacterium]